jgi:hypothetical protein
VSYARLGHLFPYLPHQPGYHKRLKAAGPLLAAALDYLARECPSWHDQVRLLNATRCRAAPPGKQPGGPSWRDGLATGTAGRIRAGTGA